MSDIAEFYNDFMQQIYISADTGEDFKAGKFFEKAMEYLLDDGTLEDYTYLPYKKIGMKIDGYELVEDREILNLLLCDFEDDSELKTLKKSEIDLSIKRLTKFVTESIEKKYYNNLEESSPGYAISYFLYHNQKRYKSINVILLSSKVLSKTVKKLPSNQIHNYNVSYDIWDIDRFFEIENSKNKKETLIIDIESEFNTSIPSLPAHISASNYPSYLCVVSGDMLAKLYEKYGSKLLESNVRSFLQFRAKINKGIRKTINEEPNMFFAYNNGITATAEDVELNKNGQIVKLQNFQIVNGGQTTASLFNTKKVDKADLSDVFVQMKLTIINDDKVNIVVPNISKYANTQNKVNDADFFSNDLYHIRMEEKSRRIWAPAKEGELKGTKWFYERARGQYLEIQSKLTPAKKREFKAINPSTQKFDKEGLAKYLMVWENKPNIVSLGRQKNFAEFGKLIVPRWNKSDQEFNDTYFMHAVAKIIIFTTCDKIINKETWCTGFKANIVAYTLSTISYLLEKNNMNVDFTYIWKTQDIPIYFIREIKRVGKFINDYILDTPQNFTNVSEWCKKDLCWSQLKDILNNSEEMKLSDDFLSHMLSNEELNYESKEAKKEQKIENEMELLKKILKITPDIWQGIIQWGTDNKVLTTDQVQLLNLIPLNKFPSDAQSKKIVKIILFMEDEGMKSIW